MKTVMSMKTIFAQLTFASWITLSRIALTPFVIYFFMTEAWTFGLCLFVIAMLTDLCDGFIARRFGQESRIGQILDPFADKILLSSVMYTLLLMIDFSSQAKLCVWFLIAKEFVLLFGGGLLLWKRQLFIPPTMLSRFVSVCEIVLVVMLVGSQMTGWHLADFMLHGVLTVNVFMSAMLLLRYVICITKK